MPISRERANSGLYPVTFDFPDTTDTLTLWCSFNAVTPEWQRHIRRATLEYAERRRRWERRRSEALAALSPDEALPEDLADETAFDQEDFRNNYGMVELLRMIHAWDLLEYDISPENPDPPKLPITVETLEGLGWPLLRRIITKIGEAMAVDPTKLTSTGNGSGPAPVIALAAHRNGQS